MAIISLPYLTGQEPKSPREEFFYFSDDGDLTGLRYDNWKVVFHGADVPPVTFENMVGAAIPVCDSENISICELEPYERADHYLKYLIMTGFLIMRLQLRAGASLCRSSF